MGKKVLIAGGGAGGMTAATQIKRQNPDIEVTLFESGSYVSWAGCPTPYYIAGLVGEMSVVHFDAEYFKNDRGIDVYTHTPVELIDFKRKIVSVNGEKIKGEFPYDQLILSLGAKAVVPPIPGLRSDDGKLNEGIFILRDAENAFNIKEYIDKRKVKNALIIGSGFIGLEMAEALTHLGISVTVVEMADGILPMLGTDEQRKKILKSLEANKVALRLGTTVKEIVCCPDGVEAAILSDGTSVPMEFLLVSIGVRPNLSLLEKSGFHAPDGKLIVNENLETGIPDVYALGDMVWTRNLLTGKPVYAPFGDVADKQGLALGGIIAGSPLQFRGVIGSAATSIFEWQIAVTGLNYQAALDNGFDAEKVNVKSLHRIMGFEDTVPGLVNVVYEKNTHRVLGASIVSQSAAAQFIDQFAIAITWGLTLDQLFDVDYAYSPKTSVVWNPILAAYRKALNR
ncbi:MAG: hypothetical protein A2Y33_00440 [Spirochaetes bacterium GWF1_51_8]|nr:MAG: hypothetical protein A2Y33_00440 [Spirochaetes bacterium GWF1_51_8]